jgi:hypothetical protein
VLFVEQSSGEFACEWCPILRLRPVLLSESALAAHLARMRLLSHDETAEETVSTLADQRRYLAEELETVCGLHTSALVEAFATVPREDFLPSGAWLIRSARP